MTAPVSATAHPWATAWALVRLVRPRQWVKNLLVFAAPLAAGVLHTPDALWRTSLAFTAFVAAAGAGYIVNDLVDLAADREHPDKRRRPLATGAVSVEVARAAAVVLFLVGLALAALTGRPSLVAALGTYEVLVVLYSLRLKSIPVVDLVTVAAGFVIRAVAGACAVGVVVSDWFLIVTSLGSLMVVSGKRYGELRALGDRAGEVRATLGSYSSDYLRMLFGAALSATLIAYCLFAFERAQTADRPVFFELSIVPLVTALLTYALLVDRGRGATPEDVVLSDRVVQLSGASWVTLLALGVYL